MPIVPATVAQPVNPGGGFDYVAIDAARRRVYAAHGGGGGLLIADADTGNVIGIVKVGDMAGVAVNPANGHVFTGNGDSRSVSEVDPETQQIVRTVVTTGPVDAIQYDPATERIYADEDDGTKLWVIDAKSFKIVATVALPGHKPEYLAVDPQTHDVYQNIASDNEVAVIDSKRLKVTKVFKTPELSNNHPLQYDAADRALLIGGENNTLAVYSPAGKLLYKTAMPGRVDQCNWDQSRGWLACAGGGIKLFSFDGKSAPKLLASHEIAPGVHTTAIDPTSGTIWVVWGNRTSNDAFIQGFTYKP
ncbi:MAG TPA: YncE family protein [Candidatus Aquilonibacter sp.]|nr:YncE family protein [Candidatus Aquilonibacter sp.]